MKRYLGWDTSSLSGVVVAFDEKNVLTEWSLGFETSRHSERLLWSIDVVLQSAGWNIRDLDGIVVGVGPGSFTGLRIGLTTAKFLANELAIPLYPLSSLELLELGAQEVIEYAREETLVVSCTDATKGEWFVRFRGRESVLEPDGVIQHVVAELKNHPKIKWMMVGQAVCRYPDLLEKLPQKRRIAVRNPSLHRIQPNQVAQLGLKAILEGKAANPIELRPHYLRDSEAEVKLKKGLLPKAVLDKPQNLL